MPCSLQAAKPTVQKNIFCNAEFCIAECNQFNLPIRWSTLHQTHALQRTVKPLQPQTYRTVPQTRHIERHTPHVSSHSISKLLETHPPPNAPFSMGSVLSLSQHIHCTSKLSVSACRSKPLKIHPPTCQNSWTHTHPQKHPFQWGVFITHQTIERHHGPITLRRLKCFGNERTHICPQIHAPTPKNTLPSKPRSPKKDTCDQPSQTTCCIDTWHFSSCSDKPLKNIFCTAEFCIAECNQFNLPIWWNTLHLQTHPSQRPAYRTAQPHQTRIQNATHNMLARTARHATTQPQPSGPGGAPIPTITHLPHGT